MKTLLVADDEFDLARTLQAILEDEGYRVETYGNGRDVLERLRRDGRQGAVATNAAPQLVLLDVMMPALSGLEVLRILKSDKPLERIPIVLMSAVVPKVKQDDYRWDGFLRKPFTIEALLHTVTGLLGKSERSGT
jgi:CheY-like chemotaxis protein